MPPLHFMNAPPNPFWAFVQDLDDHPFFAAYAPRDQDAGAQQSQQQPEASQNQQDTSSSERARGKQPADDPPEIDPSTVRPESGELPFRGRDGHHGPGRRGPGCRGRGGWRGRAGFDGPPPFAFGPPFGAGPRHHPHHHHRRRSSHERERSEHHRRRSSHERERSEQPSEQTGPGFNLGNFLNNLGDRLGIDLPGAAENMGLDKFAAPRSSEEVDFEPRTDIFDTAAAYIIHAALPGAKKGDIAVDWDGEHSILRLTGVVHRPDVDEELLKQLVVNGRKRENGVFEKAIRLGTKRDPANVDVAGISARMVDGVLIVKVPKVDREVQKREVPISGSVTPEQATNEKDLLFDADEEMYDAVPERENTGTHAATKAKAVEARDDRSVTAGREEETLPQYEAEEEATNEKDMNEWERDSEEEGDYVKISVD